MSSGSGSRDQLRNLIRRLQDMKESWEMDEEPDPDDPRFQGIVHELRELSEVTEVNLVGKTLGDSVIRVIGKAMGEVPFKELKTLELGGNFIKESGIWAIANAIEAGHLDSLESLGLFPPRRAKERKRFVNQYESQWSRNQIGDGGLRILASAFSSGRGSRLKVLSLEQNSLSAGGARALAHAIQDGHLPNLEILNVSYNNLGDEGTQALARAFATTCTHLKVLDLEYCIIGREGTEALAGAFMSGHFPELTELYVGNNNNNNSSSNNYRSRDFPDPAINPYDEGLIQLASVLRDGHLPKLQILDLTDNAGGKKSAEAFRNALRYNKSLALELKINWPSFGPYAGSARKLKERNARFANLLQRLQTEEDVKATNGKIFLCGHPMEGKTTLRRSLQKDLPPFITIMARERKPHVEPRTRGIEVSHIARRAEQGEEPVTIAIWDLAGQSEYQILHSAFLPDLAMGDGPATTFVIVCNANCFRSNATSQTHGADSHGRQVLNYWMRFIASSSLKGVDKCKRQVLVVLNRFNDEPCEYVDYWVDYLKELKKIFHEYLEIQTPPFVVDARVAREVKGLKDHLMFHTRRMLEAKKVPKICKYMQDTIQESLNTREFPVIPWTTFAAMFQSLDSDQAKLKDAVEYLHESGHLIHFREGQEGSISEGVGPGRSLVVLDPDWFCRKVVGHLLLPGKLLDADETPLNRQVCLDGSLALRDLKMHFHHLLHNEQQVSDIVAMLLRLGICYMVGDDKVLIPALIEGNKNPSGYWEPTGKMVREQWVMGYCLKVQYRNTTLLPIAVFRRLQVELGQDPMFTAADSDYIVGKFYITFSINGMAVLVEFSANEEVQDLQDRIDILVRPLVSRDQDRFAAKRRERQVDLAQMILLKFVNLAEIWSPGVEFVREVVKPWSTTEGTLPMVQRDVKLSVEDLKLRVQADGPQAETNWRVGEELVMAIDLLSGLELREWENSVRARCDLAEKLIADMKFVPPQQDDPNQNFGDLSHSSSSTSQMDEQMTAFQRLQDHIDKRFEHMFVRMDDLVSSFQDVREDLGGILCRQREVLQKLQALERFSRDEIKRSVPRFMYLTKVRDSSGIWMTLKDRFVENATLHFLCEAHYDYRSVHEVQHQEGVEISNLREWAAKIAPWVIWSLKVAFVAGKVASQALLPGLGQLINTFPTGEAQDANISSAAGYLFSAVLIAGAETTHWNGTTDISTLKSSTPSRSVEVKEDLKEVLDELIGKMAPTEFHKKFKLRKVVVNQSGYVEWICDDCYKKYSRHDAVESL